ncbi:hypothetical protein ACQEU5_03450 [Marinactinospora thermotolerans]|uniref:Uncharacterized protein n=1 Tax=Marinactinospora thermotolerans DSM 45154 TaxID=1122192 RepID=A0A1T4LBJ6_9ACTN|nr:hypothetical protein [Marinactinospora thermotolerans]SJZ52192.1 hypothetical protein SAMN02745673_00616 [Marinactinospora thermotolerans DSM 45154]
MEYPTPAIRRMCLAVDAESYGDRGRRAQHDVQQWLVRIMDLVCKNADLDRSCWDVQPQGDGELALLQPGIEEARVIAYFTHELAMALYHHNAGLRDDARLRLRVAFDQGNVALGPNGYTGAAVVSVCRLRDSLPARRALRDHPDVDFALVVSDSIYTDVVYEGDYDLYERDFTPVDIDEPEKRFRARAWIHVPTTRQRDRGAHPPTEITQPSPDRVRWQAPYVTHNGPQAHVRYNYGTVTVHGGGDHYGTAGG